MLKPAAKQHRVCDFWPIIIFSDAFLVAFVGRIKQHAGNYGQNVVQLLVLAARCSQERHGDAVRVPPARQQNGLVIAIPRAVIGPQSERGTAHGFHVHGVWDIRQVTHIGVILRERPPQPRPQVARVLLGNPFHLRAGQKDAFQVLHSFEHAINI